MPLTSTQREFLVTQLQIKPKRKRGLLERKTKDERVDVSLNKSIEEYLRREAKVIEALRELAAVPATTELMAPLERDLADVQRDVAVVKRSGGAKPLDQAYDRLESIKSRARAAATKAKANASYFTELDAANTLLSVLKRHAQQAHVSGEIGTAGTELDAARAAAGRDDFTAARACVVRAKAACVAGKNFADAYAAYLPIKADAGRIVAAMEGVFAEDSIWEQFATDMATANKEADTPERKYAGSSAALRQVVSGLKAYVVEFCVTDAKVEIATLQATVAGLETSPIVKPGGSVVQPTLDAIAKMQTQVEADIAASRWGQALMGARTKVSGMVTTGLKTAQRRKSYDADRAATVAKIDGLKTHKSLLGQVFSLQKLVERADGLASAESLRMEDGRAELKQVDATCAQLKAVAGDAEKYLEERVEADKESTALLKLPTVGKLQAQLDSIDALLAKARQTTGIVDAKTALAAGPNMEDHQAFQQDWASALAQVVQARALIKATRDIATSLGDTAKSLENAGNAKNLQGVTKAAADLRKQTETATSQPHADQAVSEFGQVLPALDKALQQAGEGQMDAAAESLKKAAELLLTARTVQAEYGRTLVVRTALAERARALTTSTEPAASTLKGKTDPLMALLQSASDASKARDWHAADLALGQAGAAATEVELIARLRKEYDARALQVELQSHSLNRAQEKEVREVLNKARARADGFNLDHANRLLDNAEARIAGNTVAQLANSKPDDAELINAIRKMLAAKGAEELQEQQAAKPGESTIKKSPDGPKLLDAVVKGLSDQVAPRVIAMIAKERFGIDFFVSALYEDNAGKITEEVRDGPGDENHQEDGGHKRHTQRGRSGRRMYSMLALVPEQAKDNPSMKRVERRDALTKNDDGTLNPKANSGGFYQSQGDLVVMSGRPGDSSQEFGKNIADQLPDKLDKNCEPANDDALDYFDFAVVHEVGHAVDDRIGFMASREGQAAYGGWVTYGGDITSIVKAVGKHTGYNSTDEQAEYINDVILGATPTPPSAPQGETVAWEAARLKVQDWYTIVTNESLWWDQAQSMSVAIDGVIYQRAYAGTWVSYLAAARSKGMTGYQFRAPGEWFAELYACYHMGKLKPGHPARTWLSSLSL